MAPRKPQIKFQPWLYRLSMITASCTFLLLVAGALVTGTGSEKAVPDWPLSFGQFFPPMKGGVLFEHGHRLVAGSVGLLMLGLAFAIQKWEERRWVKALAWCALGIVGLQSVLGGLSILRGLPLGVAVFHSGLAPAFFCLTVVLALVSSRQWIERQPKKFPSSKIPLSTWALAGTVAVYFEILIGALLRYSGAGSSKPDFSVGLSQFVFKGGFLQLMAGFGHIVWSVMVLALVTFVFFLVKRRYPGHKGLGGPAQAAVLLVWAQFFLGAMVVITNFGVVPTTIHIAMGSAVLASMLVLTLNSHRIPSRA